MIHHKGKSYTFWMDLVSELESERDAALRLNCEYKAALEEIRQLVHPKGDEPRLEGCSGCKAERVLGATEKRNDETPTCSVCKEPIGDGFAIRKAAWCEKCGGYSHNNCWAAHNLTYCTMKGNA